jgi:hypothetical protein
MRLCIPYQQQPGLSSSHMLEQVYWLFIMDPSAVSYLHGEDEHSIKSTGIGMPTARVPCRLHRRSVHVRKLVHGELLIVISAL